MISITVAFIISAFLAIDGECYTELELLTDLRLLQAAIDRAQNGPSQGRPSFEHRSTNVPESVPQRPQLTTALTKQVVIKTQQTSISKTCDHFDSTSKDPTSHSDPGGTEEESMHIRQSVMKFNFPVPLDSANMRWQPNTVNTRRAMPAALKCVQVPIPSVSLPLEMAEESCGGTDNYYCLLATIDDKRLYGDLYADSYTQGGRLGCSGVYGAPLIHRFNKGRRPVCEGSRHTDDTSPQSRISCDAAVVHATHEINTAVCNASDISVQFSKMSDGDYPWLSFGKGALMGKCRDQNNGDGALKFMHCLADWLDLGYMPDVPNIKCDNFIDTPTYFITRSGDFSPFAAVHDLLNSFILYLTLRLSPADTQLVMMDRMGMGFYTPMYQRMLAPAHDVQWYPDLKGQGTKCYRRAYLNIPARLSPIYNNDGCGGSTIFRLFSDLILSKTGNLRISSPEHSIVITVVARKNYGTGHSIGRRIGNHDALVAALRSRLTMPVKTDQQGPHSEAIHIVVNSVDFASFDFDQQVGISRATDVMIAMHGAGLVQMLFMGGATPANSAEDKNRYQVGAGGVFEFFCPEKPSSNYRYSQLAQRLGLLYSSYEIGNERNTVPIDEVLPQISALVAKVWARKNQKQ